MFSHYLKSAASLPRICCLSSTCTAIGANVQEICIYTNSVSRNTLQTSRLSTEASTSKREAGPIAVLTTVNHTLCSSDKIKLSNGDNSTSSISKADEADEEFSVTQESELKALKRSYAPSVAPATAHQIQSLVDLIQDSKQIVVLTGAGCSTESDIPDYRGPSGAYTTGFTPMTHQQFLASPANRARYWSRSFAGWPRFASVRPNDAHIGLSRLQQHGWVGSIITQNVDRLHQAAGSQDVIELHGTTHRVCCLSCGATIHRHEMQARLAALNPTAAAALERSVAAGEAAAVTPGTAGSAAGATGRSPQLVPVQRPDGDVELVDAGVGFQVPHCSACYTGILKPDVVFFGDSLPVERKDRALELACQADLILAVGTSLQMYSAFRLVDTAVKTGAQLAIVNVGDTWADALARYKVEARAGEVMARLATHPTLLLSRG